MQSRILVVEDDEFKRQRILDVLSMEVEQSYINSARSVVGAIDAIDKYAFRLLVLDLAIPDYEDGPDGAQGLGGITVFRYLHELQPSASVVVITQFEALKEGDRLIDIPTIRENLEREFGAQFLGLIQYRRTDDSWIEVMLSYLVVKGTNENSST